MIGVALQTVAQKRNISRVFPALIVLIADVLKSDIAVPDLQAVGAHDGLDAFVHAFVDGTAKPDPRIVAKQTKLRIRRPVEARAEAQATLRETIEDLKAFDLKMVVPGHCTGWRAIHKLVETFGEDRVVPSAVGRTHRF